MKKIFGCLALCSALFATSCTNENLAPDANGGHQVKVKVSVGEESRTMIGDNGMNVWNPNAGEEIFVISEDGNVYGTLQLDESSLGEDGNSAFFKGTVIGNPAQLKYAYYPAPRREGNEWIIRMNDVDGKNHKAPMYGNVVHDQAGSWSVNFNNAGALVRFQITGIKGEAVGFTAQDANDKYLTGGYYHLNNGSLEFESSEDSREQMTTIYNFPEDGIVYLPIGLDAQSMQVRAASSISISAVLHENQGPRELFEIENIPVEKNYISTYSVPNFDVPETGEPVKSEFIYATSGEGKHTWETALNADMTSFKLAENIVLERALVLNVNKTITLDLNGKKVELTGTISGGGAVFEVSNGVLNIIGNGQVIASTEANATGNNAVWVRQNGKVNIYGGTFSNYGKCIKESDVNKQNDQEDLIYVGSDAQEGAKINVYGGDFSSKVVCGHFGLRWLLNQNNNINSQRIFVWGGTFHNFNPANAETHDEWMSSMTEGGKTFGSYLAEGYIVENASEGVFVVKPDQKK